MLFRSNTQIIDEKNAQIKELEDRLKRHSRDSLPIEAINKELKSLYGEQINLELTHGDIVSDKGVRVGSRVVCILSVPSSKKITTEDVEKIKKLLLRRTGAKEVRVIVEGATVQTQAQIFDAPTQNEELGLN